MKIDHNWTGIFLMIGGLVVARYFDFTLLGHIVALIPGIYVMIRYGK